MTLRVEQGKGRKDRYAMLPPILLQRLRAAGKLLVAEQLPDNDAQKVVLLAYAREFEAKYGPRNTFGGHAWDAVHLVVKGLEKAGTDRAGVRSAIESTRNFVGITGVFDFSATDHNGLDRRAATMIQIVDGNWRPAK